MDQEFSPIDPVDYPKVRGLFDDWQYHLAALAVLSCSAEGQVYVDDPASPSTALVRAGHRFHLVGNANVEAFNRGFRELLVEELPAKMTGVEDMFQIYYAHSGWEAVVDWALKDRYPLKDQRNVYTFRAFKRGWRQGLPPEYEVHLIKPEMLENKDLKNVDELKEEMLSEVSSLEEFFAYHFGVCIIYKDEVVSWCLSEYNCIEGCEVGIATMPEYRKKGLATAAAGALVEQAHTRGINWIGWHCWADNKPSVATALAAGFELAHEYQTYYGWFNQATNLAANGNARFWNGKYKEADVWYERAFAAGDPPGWAYWNAACAAARTGKNNLAIQYLHKALEKGYGSLDDLHSSEHLKSLRKTSAWQDIVNTLSERQHR